MASIRKRGPYQWQARIRKKGYPEQAKTHYSKADAEAWAAEIESEMVRGIFVSREEAEKTTLSEAILRYIDEHIPKLSNPKSEKNRTKALLKRQIANQFLASIRTKDIAAFIKEREDEGVKPNTIRLDLSRISHIFQVASSDWGMESLSNPVRRVKKPKLPSGRTRRLQEDEEKLLLESCSANLRPAILFAIETAMRRSEIASLRWENVSIKGRSAHLPLTKNGESRTVPLSPAAIEILRSMPRNISGTVFGISTGNITNLMRKACAKAGLQDLNFHDLRHEAASRLFENTDLDVMEIKTITGHKSLQMLARYSHLRTHRLADRLAGRKRGE